ncbi:hypothetical protein D3C81_1154110 [compost metagenome]
MTALCRPPLTIACVPSASRRAAICARLIVVLPIISIRPTDAAAVLRPVIAFSSPKRKVADSVTVCPRFFLGSSDTFKPSPRVNVSVRAAMFSSVASNASPESATALPTYPSTRLATGGAAGITARSGAAVGTKRPKVRLLDFRYAAATRLTSAALTLAMASRCTNSKRQSPAAWYSDNAIATALTSLASFSRPLPIRCLEAVTSSSVIGRAAMDSTCFSSSASALPASPSLGRTPSTVNKPGSR